MQTAFAEPHVLKCPIGREGVEGVGGLMLRAWGIGGMAWQRSALEEDKALLNVFTEGEGKVGEDRT